MLLTVPLLHPLGDTDILGSVITAHTARNSMEKHILKEQVEDSGCAVVGAGTNAGDKAGIAIDKSMDDNAPSP